VASVTKRAAVGQVSMPQILGREGNFRDSGLGREGGSLGRKGGRKGGREGERGRIILELIEAAAEYQCSDECSHLGKMSRLRGSGMVAKGGR